MITAIKVQIRAVTIVARKPIRSAAQPEGALNRLSPDIEEQMLRR